MQTFRSPDRSVTLAYDQAGHFGPRVLLVQGVACVGEGWRPQIAELARDHQLAWFDNRGIGASHPYEGAISVEEMARDCHRLLDHLGWPSAHFVGHSLGGIIVQQVARDIPSRVASLSLLSTLRRGREATMMTLANIGVSLRSQFGSARTRWLTLAEMPFPRTYLAKLSDAEKLGLTQMMFCRNFLSAPAIVRKQVAALWRHRGGDMTSLRAIPTLIVTGALDIVVRTRLSDDLKAHLPKARLERFDDAGHGVPISHAAAVNALLRTHFAANQSGKMDS
jgi:pimeloyl-ACP methyl ester carboxylesterase